MVDIMETLDSIENKKMSDSSYNAVMYRLETGNPDDAPPSAEQRAKDLFEALPHVVQIIGEGSRYVLYVYFLMKFQHL